MKTTISDIYFRRNIYLEYILHCLPVRIVRNANRGDFIILILVLKAEFTRWICGVKLSVLNHRRQVAGALIF